MHTWTDNNSATAQGKRRSRTSRSESLAPLLLPVVHKRTQAVALCLRPRVPLEVREREADTIGEHACRHFLLFVQLLRQPTPRPRIQETALKRRQKKLVTRGRGQRCVRPNHNLIRALSPVLTCHDLLKLLSLSLSRLLLWCLPD